jgi:hypothetical protein
MTPERIRAWIGHAAAIETTARMRVDALGHRHHHGHERCPICSRHNHDPSKPENPTQNCRACRDDRTNCGLDDCDICGR